MNLMRRWHSVIIVITLVGLLFAAAPAFAHASLVRSSPAANAILPSAPSEIRLWFTEPLEPDFSRFTLRDGNGNTLDTPHSQLDPNDAYQLFMEPGVLSDGLYTVSWRVVSSADGHQTSGSFSFIIGEPIEGFSFASTQQTAIPADSAAIRWLNLLSLALLVGGLGFILFVWRPTVSPDYANMALASPSQPPAAQTIAHNHLIHFAWASWLLAGATALLMLLLQVSIFSDVSLLQAISHASLGQILTETRYGHLWLARLALWIGLGLALWYASHDGRFAWVALGGGLGILLVQSMFSHASAAQDEVAGVANDWLHMVAAAFWLGGLAQFLNVILPLRRNSRLLATLVAHFSNFARILVATLILTGLYSAWLQVGTLDGLLNTRYGQALLIKLVLILPLVGIAGINLLVTRKRLQEGVAVWGQRLQGLVSAEILLVVGIVAAVGVMTAIAPARVELEDKNIAAAPEPQPNPIIERLTADGLNLTLTISPGWVGENTFDLSVTDRSGTAITDVSLIRLRFESQTENLGESELRIEPNGDSVYTTSGTNLSVPGKWRLRATIQRPNQYDAVVDFMPQVATVPPAPPPPILLDKTATPLPWRIPMLLLTGSGALALGGYFLGIHRLKLRESLPALGLIMLSIIFLATGTIATRAEQSPTFEPAPETPIKLVIGSDRPLPYLITAGGDLLRPTANNDWQVMELHAKVEDAHADAVTGVWAATDSGLYRYKEGQWTQIEAIPTDRLVMTHGYLFAMRPDDILRGPDHWRTLIPPLADTPPTDLMMLGDHTHILQNGNELFHTIDLGLGWEKMNPPDAIEKIWVDDDYNLLASTPSGIVLWDRHEWRYEAALPPGNRQPDDILSFKGRVYAIVEGELYRQQGLVWEKIAPFGADDAYLTSLGVQRKTISTTEIRSWLWILNAAGSEIVSTEDGKTWTKIPIVVN